MRMRPGFARGGRRVLKWMALFGVVFAVGAGSASAQFSVDVLGVVDGEVNEGRTLVVVITGKLRLPAYGQPIPAPPFDMEQVQVATRVEADSSGDVSNVGSIDGVTAADANDISGGFGPRTRYFNMPRNRTETMDYTLEQRVNLPLVGDFDAEDEQFRLRFTMGGGVANVVGHDGQAITPLPTIIIRIKDNEEQTFEWETPDDAASPREGTPTTRTLKADPAPENMVWNVALSTDEAGYVPSLGATTLTSANATREITITPPDNDGNREDDTIELNAFLAGTSSLLPGIEPLEIEFPDLHTLPEAGDVEAQAYEDREGDAVGVTTTETDSVTEGGEPVHVRVTIDRGTNGYPMGEKLIVRPEPVDPAQRADYRIEPNSIEIPTGPRKQHADFVLYARPDDDVGDETLALNLVTTGEKAANGPGEVVGTFSIDVVDDTTKLIAAKPRAEAEAVVMEAMGGGPLNPGDTFTLDVNELFDWAPAAVDAAFAASVRGAAASARVSGETVTVEAKEAGDAAVTVTATGTARGSSAVGTSQTVANTASVTFDVQVVLADLAITLSGPEDANVVEGGQPARVTATANRAVTKDTTVRLSATGGDAVPGDYSVGNVVIEAGDDEGSTRLTATADDEAERSETLTLRGVFVDDESGEDGQTVNSLTFNLWDAAVPALPVAAQLLLAAFLAVGGCRRYLRRR